MNTCVRSLRALLSASRQLRTRTLSPACIRTYTSASEASASDLNVEDFGNYSIILPPEPFMWGTSHITPRPVPTHIVRPPYARNDTDVISEEEEHNGDPWIGDGRIKLGSEEEAKLRNAAQLAKRVLDYAGNLVKVGITTDAIDECIHEYIISHSAYPSPLLYSNFPKSCCTSVNNIVVHGIPDARPLEDGDIVNVDITVYLDGYHGDTSRTFTVGRVDDRGRNLIEITTEALEAGIRACRPGQPFREIGEAIHHVVQDAKENVCVSGQFTGHGIGTVFHRPPWIYHCRNEEPGVMLPGHCFTIEPCIIQGSRPHSWIFPDGWTASTENCARGAQAEHMVLITESGADVLTA